MQLKGQDILVLLKLVVYKNEDASCTYARLSDDLGISTSQLYAAVQRSVKARLIDKNQSFQLYKPNLKEFLIHAVKYCFPAEQGGLTRGIPTAYAAPPLNSIIVASGDPPPVWPYSKGEIRGLALLPLHPSLPDAAMKDAKLYEMLALVDSIRAGRAREREYAIRELTARIDKAW